MSTTKIAGIAPGIYHGMQDDTFVLMNEIEVDGHNTIQERMRYDCGNGNNEPHLNTNWIGYIPGSRHGRCLDLLFRGSDPSEKFCRYIAHTIYMNQVGNGNETH